MRKGHETPTLEELDCLIMWPEGSVGETQDRRTLFILLKLCRDTGFGRIPQLANAIEDIWRHPEAVKKHKKQQTEHRKLMKDYEKTLNTDTNADHDGEVIEFIDGTNHVLKKQKGKDE